MTTIVTRAGKGSALTWTEGDANITNLNNDKIEAVVDDTTPQLGGDLDVNGNKITATSGNIELDPGTGSIVLGDETWPSSSAGGSPITGTVTDSDAETDQLTLSTVSGLSNDQAITFTGTGLDSVGLSLGTTYYITNVLPATTGITISTSIGGATYAVNTVVGVSDVSFSASSGSSAPTTGQVLTYGTGGALAWSTPTSGATSLSTLTDVSISGMPTSGQVLTYDTGTSKWTNQNASSGGIANVVEDTTPQLGGTLDANGNSIDMGTNTITDTKVGNWDTAYGWGNHSVAGYLTSETYTGTVTSVGGTGTVNGLTLSGTVTSSGSLTLGGTLDLTTAPAIGSTSASTGKFTNLTVTGTVNAGGSNGTNGQVLQSTGTGVQWATASGGGTSFAILQSNNGNEITTTGTNQTITSSFAEVIDANSLVTVSGNDFTITSAGTYSIEYSINKNLYFSLNTSSTNVSTPSINFFLYDVTNSANRVQIDLGGDNYSTGSGVNRTFHQPTINFKTYVTITGSTTYRFRYSCASGSGYNTFNINLFSGSPKSITTITKIA